jgi:cytochrome b involved in lipid metabolism
MTTPSKENNTETSDLKVYTWDEIKKHNKESDLWVVYKGKVIDVTKFQKEHPGGAEVLQDNAGKDITEPFEDIGHPPHALEIMESYKIGVVVRI